MNLRHAWRALRRTPAFSLTAILTLAIGIGAVGAMFAIVHGVLLAPLPYGTPERLVSVRLQSPASGEIRLPLGLHGLWSQHARTLDGIAFLRTGNANLWIEGSDAAADSVIATWVTASTFSMLQVPPLLGRGFSDEEAVRGGPEAAILGESEWRDRFGAAPDVIGRTVVVNSVPRRIVGVMPARFVFPLDAAPTRVWLPAKRSDGVVANEFAYTAVARLAAGATPEAAQRDLAALLPAYAAAFPQLESGASTAAWFDDIAVAPTVAPLRESLVAGIARTLWLLAAVAGLVLLVAWANLANLLLVRADVRQPELAVRAALGADRLRMAMPMLAEAILLGAAAAVLATLLVHAAVALLVAFGPSDVPRLARLGVTWPTFGFIALATAASVAVCTVVPAAQCWRTRPTHRLREGGRGASMGASRLRAVFTALQIALALVVMLAAALLLRTASGLAAVQPGFDAAHVTTLRTQLPLARYGNDADAVAFYGRVADAVRQLPSVQAAGLASRLPLAGRASADQIVHADGENRTASLRINTVDDGYFAAMAMPLLAGRGLGRPETARGNDVVISRLAAQALFGDDGGERALGRQLRLEAWDASLTVVGVVGDVRDDDLTKAPAPTLYRALALPVAVDATAEPPRNMALVVRADGAPGATVSAVRRIVRDIDRTVPIYGAMPMQDVVRASTARLSLVLVLMTAAALVTLVLGAIGLYGVMAYTVALRAREFGVRVALGAAPARIARLVARRGLRLTAAGLAGGFVLYALTVPLLRSLLFGVTASDPVTLLGATLLLLATASLASWLPTRRAARVDPAKALRAE